MLYCTDLASFLFADLNKLLKLAFGMAIPQQWWKLNSEVDCIWKNAENLFSLYISSLFLFMCSFGCSIVVWANCCCYQCKLTFVYLGLLTTWCPISAWFWILCGFRCAICFFAFIWCSFRASFLNLSFCHSIFWFGSSWSNVWQIMNKCWTLVYSFY